MRERRSRIIGAKAFQFKLKPVLDMRQRELETAQQRFAEQQNRVLQVQQQLSENQILILQTLVVSTPEETADPVTSQQRFRYVQHLKIQALHLQRLLQTQEKRLELLREALQQAHIRKRSLELLEEKQTKTYLQALEAQEAKEMEDLVLSRRHHRT